MFIAMTLWSGSWISGKLISGGTLHFQFIFWRFVITSICYLIIYLVSIKKNNEYPGSGRILRNPPLMVMIILSAIALIGYNTMFILGLTTGLAGKGGVIMTTLNPLIGFIIGAIIYKKLLVLQKQAHLHL